MMVTAGSVVDEVIARLLPHLEPGDVLIDGGNSFYRDTERRFAELKARGIRFLGMGVSGGEEGARHGPALMPGGDPEAWPLVKRIFQSIAARADDGEPCCRWVGEGGAGHYVKMVHNGIEYGDMQLIAEAWQLLDQGLGLSEDAVANTFAEWNSGVLSSYLVEITAQILRVRDPDGVLRVRRILDSAGQKGTGRWTAVDALQLGVPLTLIAEAVYARALSARKDERERAAARLSGPDGKVETGVAADAIRDALYAAKIISYAQGFMQMREAAVEYGWKLAFGDIALLWRAGCIIRSRFLEDIAAAFARDPALENLLLDPFFSDAIAQAQTGWRRTVGQAVTLGIAVPALSSALAFYDGYRSAVLPANLLQAQRDYFGAHTYRRIDRPGVVFHTHWAGDAREETQ
jgi:6-phosphogluconate dehydrogenase